MGSLPCRAWWHRPRGSRGVFRVYVRQRDEAPGDWGERTSPTPHARTKPTGDSPPGKRSYAHAAGPGLVAASATRFDGGAPCMHCLRVIPILCLGSLATARLASHETRVGFGVALVRIPVHGPSSFTYNTRSLLPSPTRVPTVGCGCAAADRVANHGPDEHLSTSPLCHIKSDLAPGSRGRCRRPNCYDKFDILN